MRERNPSPYMSLLPIAGRVVVGASPELFLRLEGRTATMRPIAGTARRSGDAARDELAVERLLSDPKERAEHVMLVDLCRNDMGRVSVAGSVSVDDFMIIEAYSHLFHIVSSVSSQVRAEHDVVRPDPRELPRRDHDGRAQGAGDGDHRGARDEPPRPLRRIVRLDRLRGLDHPGPGDPDDGPDGPTLRPARVGGIVADSTPDGEWAETLTKMGAAYWAVTGEELVS